MFINIQASDDPSKCQVQIQGFDKHIITANEEKSFWGSKYDLQCAVNNCRQGWDVAPDVWLRKPASKGSLSEFFGNYGWPETTVTVKPVVAKVIELHRTATCVAERTYHCPKSNPRSLTYQVTLGTALKNGFKSTLALSNEISVGASLTTSVDFLGTGIQAQTSMNCKHNWSQSYEYSRDVTVDIKDACTLKLKPGEKGICRLCSNIAKLKIEVEYVATIEGSVCAWFENKWNGHYIWNFPIQQVLSTDGHPIQRFYKEEIEVEYYFTADLKVDIQKE